MTELGIRRTVNLPYDQAIARVTETLKQNGFGVLTEIDMKAKLKEKLGVDFKRYSILGACNPPLAHKALQSNPEIGLLLPCNVIVYEAGEGKSVVSAINPDSMTALLPDNSTMAEVAADAKARLTRALDSL